VGRGPAATAPHRSPAHCPPRTAHCLAIALLFATAAPATTLRVFGSAGAEAQLTPANESSPINPGNLVGVPRTTNAGDITTFFEALPQSRSWKIRVKARADASDRASDTLRIDEGFLQLNVRPWLDLTAGRLIEKWGAGYAWNPVGFVSPQKNPTDPNDRRSAYRGLDMLKADVFVRGTNVSLYAMERGVIAARVYRLIADTDVSLHFRRDRGENREGVSVARVFGNALEIHGEFARIEAGRTYTRSLAGGQYTFPNNVNVVAELYHAGDGFSQAEWDSFRNSVAAARTPDELLAANAVYAPLRMARNYGFVRVDVPWSSLKNDLELIALANLRDGSSIFRLAFTRKLRPNLTAYAIETEFAARPGSELSFVQIERSTVVGMRLYF
jgi:hypothetical protein